jgi:3,4-dihydroxy 2-butanone 4-phosphate synthase / GTP cyclohydrolase II
MSGNQQNEINDFNTIEEAIEDIRNGKMIIVVDDDDRENEGDFIVSAEKITPEIVNFMAKHGRGLICASITETRCAELDLELMVGKNTAIYETPFTVSVDLNGYGCTTGISASDRAKTIKALVDENMKPADFGRPGHIFPLRAKENGVLRRPGHTEAVVDITRLAGLKPGGALVEIMNDDGTMARLPELMKIAKKFDMKIISIEDLIKFRLKTDSLIEMGDTVKLPSKYGQFKLIPFRQKSNGLEHVAIFKGEWSLDDEVLVRVHSSCLTGDILGSMKCDCGNQLHKALRMVEEKGQGVVLYMQQEGRGIGLFNKIKAYKLQEQGLDTVEANLKLGFKEDERDYGIGAQMLRSLGVRKVNLITNNPRKIKGLEGFDLEIINTTSIESEVNEHNKCYLETKKNKMGHSICIKNLDILKKPE